ncbi:MAG: CAP domain-containing protein [Firmicutes bacterium]|nr:CAP domain-containing protein [Bacillota bacterium]
MKNVKIIIPAILAAAMLFVFSGSAAALAGDSACGDCRGNRYCEATVTAGETGLCPGDPTAARERGHACPSFYCYNDSEGNDCQNPGWNKQINKNDQLFSHPGLGQYLWQRYFAQVFGPQGANASWHIEDAYPDAGSGSETAAPPTVDTPSYPSSAVEAYAQQVVDLVNQERAKENLPPLGPDQKLAAAAQVRAGEIMTRFSHTRPDGRDCFTALAEAGAAYNLAGENIAIGQNTPADVVADWMASPGHRANILNPGYSRIGVGVRKNDGNAYGGYAWTQFFAD